MSPAHDDGKLHLVAVAKQKVVLRVVPSPIQAERICVALDASGSDGAAGLRRVALRELPLPHAGKERHLLGEDVAVDDTSVHGEDTHHEHDVASVESHREQLVLLAALERLLPVDHS